MLYQREDLYSNWGLDFKQSSLDHAVRILHHLPLNIFRVSMLFTHAVVPSAFRLQVSVMIQESPSQFFLTVSGILKPRHAAHGSKILTAGALIPLVDRNFGKSFPNGSGIFVWNADNSVFPHHFAPQFLPREAALSLWANQRGAPKCVQRANPRR
jgi:hypothetical protein